VGRFLYEVAAPGAAAGSSVAASARDDPPSVLAVIVCYEPDRSPLAVLVAGLQHERVQVLLVDNSEHRPGRETVRAVAAECGAAVVANDGNIGVAAAHNVGIRRALRLGFDHVLLLDQDSELAPGAVQRLADAYCALTAAGERVAAVGPSYADARSGLAFPFARLRRLRMERLTPTPGQSVECDILISSGCFISLKALREIGEMDERLFIDFVDVEWCVRARSLGWKVYGVADARMRHRLGNGAFRVLGRVLPVHGPARYYYLTRNALLLARKPFVTWRWRAHLAYRVAGQLVLFGLLCPQRGARFGMMVRGLIDGLLGRDGPLPDASTSIDHAVATEPRSLRSAPTLRD
jgi:rhamnosyltransferase